LVREDSIVSVDSNGIVRDFWQLDMTPLIMPAAICAH